MAPPPRAELFSFWEVQETLLQNYRAIFMAPQAVIIGLAAGAIGDPWVFVPLAALGLVLLWEWKNICGARALDVSYAQALLKISESDDADLLPAELLTHFKGWQSLTERRKRMLLASWHRFTRAQKRAALRACFCAIDPSPTGEPPSRLDPDAVPRAEHLIEPSRTRVILDTVLPSAFAAVWMFLAVVLIARAG